MHNRKSGFAAAMGGALAVMLALAAWLSSAARAEDFCNTYKYSSAWPTEESRNADIEKKIREKCKVGDIIIIMGPIMLARVCDLQKTITSIDQSIGVCSLASPRKTY